MKPYSQDIEDRNVRDWPDRGDIGALGMSSKHGKQKSAGKRRVRRNLKKRARTNLLRRLRDMVREL